LPTEGSAQIRIFNTMNCPVNLTIKEITKEKLVTVNSLSMWENLEVKLDKNGLATLSYEADFTICKNMNYINNELIESKGKLRKFILKNLSK